MTVRKPSALSDSRRRSRKDRILLAVQTAVLETFKGDLSRSRRRSDEVKVVKKAVRLADQATAARTGAVVLVFHEAGIPSPEETFDMSSGESAWDLVDAQLQEELPKVSLGREDLSGDVTAYFDLGDRKDEDDAGPTGTRRISTTSSAFGPTGTRKMSFLSNSHHRTGGDPATNYVRKLVYDAFDRELSMTVVARGIYPTAEDRGRNAPGSAVVINHAVGIPSPEEAPRVWREVAEELSEADMVLEQVNAEVSAVYGEF